MKKDKKWLIERVENYIPLHDKTVRDVVDGILEIIKQLPEIEVLSPEWIENKKRQAYDPDARTLYWAVTETDLQNLLVPTLSEMETVEITEEQVMEWLDNNDFYDHATAETVLANAVDKGELGYYGTKYSVVEKPVIPKFVADWIERNRDRYENQLFLIGHDFYNNCIPPNVDDWLMDNEEKFMRAWLDGYMTEDEPKFVIDLDDEEISDGNHYLKRLEMSVDGVNIVAGDSLNSMTFESEEEAQLIAEYVGGRVEELEE